MINLKSRKKKILILGLRHYLIFLSAVIAYLSPIEVDVIIMCDNIFPILYFYLFLSTSDSRHDHVPPLNMVVSSNL